MLRVRASRISIRLGGDAVVFSDCLALPSAPNILTLKSLEPSSRSPYE